MSTEFNDSIKKLGLIFNQDKIVSPDDILSVLRGIKNIMETFKKDNIRLNEDTISLVNDIFDKIKTAHQRNLQDAKDIVKNTREEAEIISNRTTKAFNSQVKELKSLVLEVKRTRPKNGKDADESKIIDSILEKIKKLPPKEGFKLTGEEIIEKINSLTFENSMEAEKYKIDAKHIKNLPRNNGRSDNNSRALYQLHDVNIPTPPTVGQVLKWNGTAWAPGTDNNSGGGGGLTLEEPVGDIDDSNVTFTVSNEPDHIIVNGGKYRVGQGIYASYAGGTITLAAPVGTGGFIDSYYA